jgi:hypothetical protein
MEKSIGFNEDYPIKDTDKKGERSILEIIALGFLIPALTVFTFFMGYNAAGKDEPQDPERNHRLETWITSLEWCESAGIPEAINPRDRDGTPSYYSFQWKPATFRQYGERYELIEKGLSDAQIMAIMKDYELSREIVRKMVDDPKVKWENEFPSCITKKVGLPPR